MFDIGDMVLCYHTSTDCECGIQTESFYDGEQGVIRFVHSGGILRYGVEFGEYNPNRHNLITTEKRDGLCKHGHGYWLSKNNLVLGEDECEEVDKTNLMKILEVV